MAAEPETLYNSNIRLSDRQKTEVAVGYNAGISNQNYRAVAIGNEAGMFSQGRNAIAIGNQAGRTSQVANSIIIDASPFETNVLVEGFHVRPVRSTSGSPGRVMVYDAVTYEMSHGDTVGNLGVASFVLSNLVPASDQVLDLGADGLRWRDLYFSGTLIGNLNADSLTTGTVPSARISGAYTGITNLTASGNVILGDATILGNLTLAEGNIAFASFEQLAISNPGTNVALIVDQAGTEDIARFGTNGNATVRIDAGGNVIAVAFSGNGSGLTALNASEITTGTLNNERLPAAISVTSLTGNGSGLTALNASQITTGTLNNERLPSAISVTSVSGNGSGLTALNASEINTGTLNNARLPAAISVTTVSGNGAGLTGLNASQITTGTLANERLPSAISVTTVSGNGAGLTGLNASELKTGTVAYSCTQQ